MTAPGMLRAIAPGDAGEVLTLQRAAFVTEAQAHGDPALPPLTQTLAELRAATASGAGCCARPKTTSRPTSVRSACSPASAATQTCACMSATVTAGRTPPRPPDTAWSTSPSSGDRPLRPSS